MVNGLQKIYFNNYSNNVTSNGYIAGNGYILERSMIQVSTQKHDTLSSTWE